MLERALPVNLGPISATRRVHTPSVSRSVEIAEKPQNICRMSAQYRPSSRRIPAEFPEVSRSVSAAFPQRFRSVSAAFPQVSRMAAAGWPQRGQGLVRGRTRFGGFGLIEHGSNQRRTQGRWDGP